MLRMLLIRPGSTDFDEQGRIQGTLDIPLSTTGHAEVNNLGAQLQGQDIDVLYTSVTEPAAETAAILGRTLGVKVKELNKMQNFDLGLWQGMLIDDVKHKQPKVYRQWLEQPESVCPPEGETIANAKKRIRDAIGRLRKKHSEGVIGMVIPQPLASMVRCCLLQCELGDLWHASADHGQWEIFDLLPGSAEVRIPTLNGAACATGFASAAMTAKHEPRS